ncbi:hypothetical protein ACIA8C_05035 [Nocardia sp. NPDC051321]|uniref:hypothetical protein n=1 Tax=Nocardia sp. NPDC051321 TaxID=3364323 RepID=UPI0037AB042C
MGTQLSWLAGHFAGNDFAGELDEAVGAGRAAVELITVTAENSRWGCRVPDCDGTLHVSRDADTSGRPLEVICTNGHRLGVGREHARPSRPVPTKVAAWAAGVSEDTIRQWVRRGKITRYGTTRRAEFDLTELLQVAARRR